MSNLFKHCICISTLSLVFLANGCTNTSLYTRTQPKRADVVGTWVIAPSSLEEKKTAGTNKNSQQQIVFRNDGTFSIQNMPSYLFTGNGAKLLSDNGTWDLNKDMCDGSDCWWGVAFWSSKTGIQANLLGTQAPYSLEIEWAEGAYFILDKKQP